jgi:hypothetical protein
MDRNPEEPLAANGRSPEPLFPSPNAAVAAIYQHAWDDHSRIFGARIRQLEGQVTALEALVSVIPLLGPPLTLPHEGWQMADASCALIVQLLETHPDLTIEEAARWIGELPSLALRMVPLYQRRLQYWAMHPHSPEQDGAA